MEDPDLPLPCPDGGFLSAEVWWCGDEWCDCTQALIVWQSERTRPQQTKRVWESVFRSDGEPGATTDLNRVAKLLRKRQHDLYARIEWPWDRTRKAAAPTP